MLKNYLKIAIICFFAGFSQVAQSVPDTNYVDERGLRQGPWRETNERGVIFEGQFIDGVPYGRFRHFDRFDRTIAILDYSREGHAAEVTFFHPNGRIRATGFYLERLRDSTWEIFDTAGILIERVNFLDGMRHGLSELFDRNGELIESTEWYRSLRNGRWWQRTERGEQWTMYRNNLSHGLYEAHFANGNPFIRGHHEYGLREGTWLFYHETGLLDRVMLFENHRLLRKQIAIHVRGEDILIDADSVGYMHTNGRIVEIRMLDGTLYRPSQTFEQLVRSFGTENFFLATSQFLAPFRLFDSLIVQTDYDESTTQAHHTNDPFFARRTTERVPIEEQRALLILRIPTPYDVYVDGEVIQLLRSITDDSSIIPQ
ncbi:MAG: hypothetical protein FWD02_01670 [Bacteroidales bacterium]|nr:hypothetical protein [Bacteroidales bacterium]